MSEQLAWLIEREVNIDGQTITYNYDKEGDVLEIIFQKGGGIGVDLTENIVLRYNQEREEPLSLILTSPARVIEPTPFGPPSFPLTALTDLLPEMQHTIFHLLNNFPVNRFLKVSGLRLSPGDELQPVLYVEPWAELSFGGVLV